MDALKDMLPSTNIKQLHKYIGLFGNNRRYIKENAKITKPLNELLQKNVELQNDLNVKHRCVSDKVVRLWNN